MNKETTELLSKLAEQLSTTTDKLWLVLINHAHISAIIGCVWVVLIVIFWFAIYKAHCALIKKDENGASKYETYGVAAIAPMVVGCIVSAMLFIIFLKEIANIINGFFDPEYWALHRIIEFMHFQ